MGELEIRDLLSEKQYDLIIAGLQALHRERTQAWNCACAVAEQAGRDYPCQTLRQFVQQALNRGNGRETPCSER